MKKLKLRREVVRNLVPQDLSKAVAGIGPSHICTTAISCTDPLGCFVTSIVIVSVPGHTC
jgi:hypothetical protein